MKNAMRPAMLASLGIPVLQTLISKNPMKAFSKDKYQFICLSQIKGRRRYRSDLLKQEKFATALKDKIDSFKLLKKLTINPVTGSMLLEYTCAEEKIDEMMAALNEQSKKLSEANKQTQQQKSGKQKFRKVAKGAMGASAAFAAGKGAAAIGKGMGMGMKGGGVTSLLPTLFSSLNLSGLSGIVATACLAWGGYKLFTRKQIPVGPQLVWFGYKAVEGLTKK
ncbi:hypothetical protein SAMN02910357_00483 [Succinivibrio dextrinosolvens]|uniref:HMA2 domain-containing protein n=1 Tax=Succinivibrio dextrinosolvens TaxID=83771 RepID=UPI0008EE1645|nr:hypothetical protein [Succinivibrio dextrinosolvens]SFS38909.1 hypothetical protein SAMN02910357_00483 [Succinivibrio dextrinosolvens]